MHFLLHQQTADFRTLKGPPPFWVLKTLGLVVGSSSDYPGGPSPGWGGRAPGGEAEVEEKGGGASTYSSVRMLMGYRTGMLVVAKLFSKTCESSLSLHGGKAEGSVGRSAWPGPWGLLRAGQRGPWGLPGDLLTSSHWRAARPSPPRSCSAAYETSRGG